MKHRISHDLDLETARKATRKALESYQERFAKYEPHAVWKDDDNASVSFRAKGLKLVGDFRITASAIEIDLAVPFLLKPFGKLAIDVVEREVAKWVAEARKGNLD